MDDHPYDLYLTQPYNTLREATAIPAMSIFDKPRKATKPMASKGVSSSAKPKAQQSHSSSNSGIDSDIEALQNGIAAHEAAKER